MNNTNFHSSFYSFTFDLLHGQFLCDCGHFIDGNCRDAMKEVKN
jgi:hypothetical protein